VFFEISFALDEHYNTEKNSVKGGLPCFFPKTEIFSIKLFTFRFFCDIIYLAYKGELLLADMQKTKKRKRKFIFKGDTL